MPIGIGPPGLVHPSLPPRQSPAPGVGYDYGAELGNCAGGSFPRKNGQRYRLHLVSHQLGCSPVGCSFPHTALQRQADRSGESVHRVRQPRRGQRVPAQDHRKARPRHAPPLTPTVQPLPPGPRELVLKAREAANIPRHPLVLIVSPEDAAQILPLDRDARCRCCRHHAATRLSARRIRWAAVRRRTLNRPVRLCPQM